jgi:hypothetical protein
MKIPSLWQREIDAGTDFGKKAAAAIVAASKKPQPVEHHRKHRQSSNHPCTNCGGGRKQSLAEKIMARASQLAASAVDFVRDGMHIATDEQQASRLAICEACPVFNAGWCDADRGGCGCNLSLKVKARAAYCPQGRWFAHTDNYRPLVNPTRSLIFHIYPKLGAEWNWHWHIEQIRRHQHIFNGHIVIGVGVDAGTATIEEVQRLMADIRVTKWIRADNTVRLAETHTHVPMLTEVKTDDPNAIVFRYHTKGVTKTPDAVEMRWAALLWECNMDLQSVEDALASHLTCGAMRSMTPLVTAKPGDFFFAGSAYWFRAKEAFERDWTWFEDNRWIVEYIPCHLFSRHESACLLYDLTESSVIRADHFQTFIQPEWDKWRFARGLQ